MIGNREDYDYSWNLNEISCQERTIKTSVELEGKKKLVKKVIFFANLRCLLAD